MFFTNHQPENLAGFAIIQWKMPTLLLLNDNNIRSIDNEYKTRYYSVSTSIPGNFFFKLSFCYQNIYFLRKLMF